MHWTTEPPTEAGWYWMKRTSRGITRLAPVRMSPTERQGRVFPEWTRPHNLYGSVWQEVTPAMMWAGPIPEPSEGDDR